MTIKDILTIPNPRLLETSKEAEYPLDPVLYSNLVNTMRAHNGIGLAAPQIGVLQRVIVVEYKGKLRVFVNPVIVSASKDIREDLEGCLSVPSGLYHISRPHWVVVKAMKQEPRRYMGMLARIIQHEIDHLDGLLINRF